MKAAVRFDGRGGFRRRGLLLLPVAIAAAGCASDPAQDPAPTKDKEPTGMDEPSTSSGDAPGVEGEVCSSAPAVVAGAYEGSLFGAAANLADGGVNVQLACRFDGPDVFVRWDVRRRSDVRVTAVGTGFSPTVAILGPSCVDAFACGEGLPAAMLDVAGGTELVIAVGIAGDDPALLAATEVVDLGFRLSIEERAVIVSGGSCGLPGQGRCETGSACQLDASGDSHCAVVDGDTCMTATELAVLDPGAVTLLEPSLPYSDAHQHSCMGARRRDRVVHVRWEAPGGRLVASTTSADVGLALRGPGCAATDELACAPATAQGSRAEVEVAGPGSAFVFVELPVDDPEGDTSELGPFEVAIAIEPA